MEANLSSSTDSLPQANWATALKTVWEWLCGAVKHRRIRRLRISETLSLGDRRFLAIIEFDRQEFLLAGCGNSLELLARLDGGKVIAESVSRRPNPNLQGH